MTDGRMTPERAAIHGSESDWQICTCVGTCNGDPRSAYCQGLPAHVTPDRAATANPYNEAMMVDALRREYELGRRDGYDEAVKMIKRAADEFRKAKRRV